MNTEVNYSPGAFGLRGISPVKPPDPKKRVKWVLDVYFAALHHQAGHNGQPGSGDPEWMEIFSEPPPVPPLGPTVPMCDRSDVMYDATPKKYERHPRSDVRVLYCADLAERALAGFPDTLKCYMMLRYPRKGRYAPGWERGPDWGWNPAEAFYFWGVRVRMFASGRSDDRVRDITSRIRSMERAAIKKLESLIEEEKLSATCGTL